MFCYIQLVLVYVVLLSNDPIMQFPDDDYTQVET